MKYLYIVILFFCCNCNKTSNNNKEIYGTSLSFDGIDDQLIVPNYEKLRLYSGTLETWFKITKKNGQEWHALVAKELAYQVALFEYKLIGYDWKSQTKNLVTDSIPTNEWHHVALTFMDSVENGCQLYFDGRAIGKPFKINILNHGTELYIGGNRFNPQHFCGNIDEVRIWNTVRTPEEIYSNYLTEIDPTSTGLVLYYKFNEGLPEGDNQQKQYIQDETPNNLTGNLYKFELKGKTSNYVNDSPLTRKDFFSISVFVSKYLWLFLLILGVALLTFLIVKFRTRLLIKENKKLDILVTQRTNELNNSLQQKEVLIQEIHHRVKNNLQFIISLIDFELTKSDDTILAKNSLQSISRRLMAMILVHELLYRKDDVETISVREYIYELVNTLKNLADRDIDTVSFEIKMDDFRLNVQQSTSIGIITSEIITNCIKYAFNGVKEPEIHINLKVNTELNEAEYSIADNGVGMTVDNTLPSSGIGKKLIDVFCRQLQGNYYFKNENGLIFKLSFPISK